MTGQPYDHPRISERYFFPLRGPAPQRGPEQTPLRLTADESTEIAALWIHPLPAAPTLLYFHGNGEQIADQLDHWPGWARSAGLNLLLVDYPGYGASGGLPSLSSCRQAARSALTWLLAREDVPQILVGGRSVGSIFAIDVASACPPERLAGLLLESGIADVVQRLSLRVPYEDLGLDRARVEAAVARDFDHASKLSAVGAKVLVLHCRQDSLVGAEHGEALARWAGKQLLELLLFEQGDHNTIQWINEAPYRAALARLVAALPRTGA
jgi:pimeloyl-ACP methyl ester carboxylesterase